MIIGYAPPTTPPTKSSVKLQSDYVVLHHQLERSLVPRPPDLGTRLEYINWAQLGEAICHFYIGHISKLGSGLIPRTLTSPVFDHLGKVWEILPILVTSGRQRVHTWGQVPNRYSSHFTLTCPRHHEQWMVYWYCLANAPFRQTFKSLKALNFVRHWPQCVYLTSPHMTTFPRPSPSIFGNDHIKWGRSGYDPVPLLSRKAT